MWRALSVLSGDLVCFVDADSEAFSAHFATGLLGPLICAPRLQFVRGFYRRPLKSGPGHIQPTGGGRVTELTARPRLAAFYPQLTVAALKALLAVDPDAPPVDTDGKPQSESAAGDDSGDR